MGCWCSGRCHGEVLKEVFNREHGGQMGVDVRNGKAMKVDPETGKAAKSEAHSPSQDVKITRFETEEQQKLCLVRDKFRPQLKRGTYDQWYY